MIEREPETEVEKQEPEHHHVEELWTLPDRELWERQPKESARAYEAFRIYRDLGIGRSIRTAAEAAGKQRRNSSETGAKQQGNSGEETPATTGDGVPRHWYVWSKKFHWVQRVHYYDSFVDDQRLRDQKLSLNRHAAVRAERRRKAQDGYERFVDRFLSHVEDSLPAVLPGAPEEAVKRSGPAFSPFHLARLIREIREFESALQWGFPKPGKSA